MLRASSVTSENKTPKRRQKLRKEILDGLNRLLAFPGMRRPGVVEGTRELVVESYVIVYRIKDDCITEHSNVPLNHDEYRNCYSWPS